MPVNCKICKNITYSFGSSEVLGKYKASYQRCSSCGFIFVAEPFWLAESYAEPIARTDIGTISRGDENSRYTKAIIELFLNPSGAFLDFGAGFGILVRRMRDLGYSFSSLDPYCQNLFASTFRVESLVGATFDMITAFEVVEHAESPMEIFDCIFEHTDSLFFTTEIIPDPAKLPFGGNPIK
jgi:2-polyprenyl-3-methyl-5-hydroxy-6-metoxy-1,4-benzoquinol methylase